MRRILTGIPGGFPFDYNDIELLQYGTQDVVEALMRTYGFDPNAKLLLSDLYKKSGNIHSTLEGYAYVEGKLCYVPNQSVAGAAKWQIVEQTVGGTKIFQSGISHNTYVRDSLILTADSMIVGFDIDAIPNKSLFGWHRATAGPSYNFGIGGSFFYKKENTDLLMSGVVNMGPNFVPGSDHAVSMPLIGDGNIANENIIARGVCFELPFTPKVFTIYENGNIRIPQTVVNKTYDFTGVKLHLVSANQL